MNQASVILPQLQRAITLHNAGQLAAAEVIYRQVLQRQATHPDALHLLALCLHLQQRDAEALPFAEAAVARQRSTVFLNTLAEIQRASGNLPAAVVSLNLALASQPNYGDALHNLALVLEQQGDTPGAMARFEQAIGSAPSALYRANFLGLLLRGGMHEPAAAIYLDLLARLEAGAPEVVFRIAVDALRGARRRDEALHLAERWVQCWPASVQAARFYAGCLTASHCDAEAQNIYRNLFAAGVVNAALCAEAGDAFHLGGQPDQALAHYRRGLEMDPENATLRRALAGVLIEEGRVSEGIAELRRLVVREPENAQWQFDLGFYLLLNQDFAEGWRRYEARLRLPRLVQPPGFWPAEKRWDGGDCSGKTLAIWEDEGVGDSIQNWRFLPLLLQRGARVLLVLRPGLRRLPELLGLPLEIVAARAAAGLEFDFHLPIMSLPAILHAQPATIARQPYLFVAEENRATWNARLVAAGAVGKRVGLCWAGNPIHANDPWRSIPARELAILSEGFTGTFVNLQRDRRDEGLPELPGLIDLADDFDNLATTAALIANLDLVICIDSAIAHLAAALGVPTWILLPRNGDWRWGIAADDSYWYDRVRLFRQPVLGVWDPVLQRVHRCLLTDEVLPDAPPAGPQPALQPAGQPARPGGGVAGTSLSAGGNYALVAARHGQLLVNRNDRFVGRSLLEYGEFSEDEIALMTRYLDAESVVVEAGANIGALTLPLARRVKHGRVVAFEPQRLVFQILCANLALNEVDNVHAYWAALGAGAGEIAIPDLPPSVVENFGGVAAGQGSALVPLMSIDQLALERVDLIKIDVEGMEQEVVRGAAATIMKCRPVMYIENDRRENSPALITQLLDLNYQLYWHTPPLFSAANFFAQPADVFAGIVSGNVLCLPTERQLDSALRKVRGPADWPLAD